MHICEKGTSYTHCTEICPWGLSNIWNNHLYNYSC